MQQIAERVGVSQSAVSLALNGRRTKGIRIPEATRQRILDATKELGYQPNHLARAMATGQTKVIGFLGSSLDREYTAHMLSGGLRIAQNNGYLIKVLQTDVNTSEEAAIHQAIQQRLAGVVCVHFDEAALQKAHDELSRHSIPLAILDHTTLNLGSRRAPGIRVLSDDEPGVSAAIQHLAALGHSRIALFSEVGPLTAWIARENGYRQAMRQLGLPIHVVHLGNLLWGSDECQRMSKLLRTQDRPTAIACVTDYTAMVVLRVAQEEGLRVPEDLSVIGFADLEMARYASPPLTTVAQPFARMGEIVTQRLLAAIRGKRGETTAQSRPEMVPTKLVVRGSTGPANTPKGSQRSGNVKDRNNTQDFCKTSGQRLKYRFLTRRAATPCLVRDLACSFS